MNKKVMIKYTDREFNTIKNSLIEYAKRYYASTYRDFGDAAFGSMMLDAVAYIGDNLSFATDYAANESFLDSAVEYNNIIRHGKALGYKFAASPSSYGTLVLYLVVPAKTYGLGPDPNYLPVLLKGSTFSSTSGNSFILNQNVDFAREDNEIVVAKVDTTTGIPTFYAVKALGDVISGELFRQSIDVGDYTPFLRFELAGSEITEVVSVIDSEGHEYFEVDYLSQDVVYKAFPNYGDNRGTVTNILKPIVVPRRFVVERESNKTSIQFGYGSQGEIKLNSIADPAAVILQVHAKDYYTDDSFDPSNLVSTDKFGVVPSNTTLTIVTRNNTAGNVNSAVGTVTTVNDSMFEFGNITSLNMATVADIRGSLEVTNEEAITGDVSLPNSEEIKRRIYDSFASQNRAVTKQDYIACLYRMPSKFGAIKRAQVVQDDDSFKRNLNIYVLTENQDGTLAVANNTIKNNLKTWLNQYKMINDTLDLLDAIVYDIGIEFEIIVNEEKNKYSALSEGIALLKELYTNPLDIGENFSITDVYSTLKLVSTIVDVTSVKVVSKYGGSYNDASFDVDSRMSADGRFVFCEQNGIYQIHYPSSDLKGAVK